MEWEFWVSVARWVGMIAAVFVVVAGTAQPWLQAKIDAKKAEENSRLLEGQQEESRTKVAALAATAQKESAALKAQVTDLDRQLRPFVDFAMRSHRDLSVEEGLSRLHEEIVAIIRRYRPDAVITFDEDGLYFHGHERVCALRYEDLESVKVARDSKLRLAGRPVLVLELAGAGAVRIGSLGGVGVLSELAERLGRRCRGASPVAHVRPRIAVKPTT